MKTKEELNAPKGEVEAMSKKLSENSIKLTDEKLDQVAGGYTMEKLTSGARLDSGADNPSGYQISERLRPQVHSLNQAGSSPSAPLTTDTSIIDLARTLRENTTITAADIHTETDRMSIQREIDAAIAQIDSNALNT